MGLKRLAAERAVQFIQDSYTLGLGTGSSSDEVLRCIAELLSEKEISNLKGIPTSLNTASLAKELGIELCNLENLERIDLTIDGTDQFDENLNLLKGHGGALTREKIVAQLSSDYIIVAEDSKRVDKLGMSCSLPVEILSFGWRQTASQVESLGCNVELRIDNKSPYLTDQNNYILHCTFDGGIANPNELARELKLITGVVEHGLFLNMADRIIIASESGIEILEREGT